MKRLLLAALLAACATTSPEVRSRQEELNKIDAELRDVERQTRLELAVARAKAAEIEHGAAPPATEEEIARLEQGNAKLEERMRHVASLVRRRAELALEINELRNGRSATTSTPPR